MEKLKANWAANGLLPDGQIASEQSIECDVLHAAVATEAGSMFFPVVSAFSENGGQAVTSKRDVDYVGRTVAHEEVRAITLEEAIEGFDSVDLIHCDIQGAERDVIPSTIRLLTDRVRCVFVGTHSREIDGELLSCFHRAGWSLERERPVMFSHRPELTDIVGMTIRDGGQLWTNPRFNRNM
jgi:FkbM family methyltransferase